MSWSPSSNPANLLSGSVEDKAHRVRNPQTPRANSRTEKQPLFLHQLRVSNRLSGKARQANHCNCAIISTQPRLRRRDGGCWRIDRDSNPRDGSPPTHFPGVRLRPLGHRSVARCYRDWRLGCKGVRGETGRKIGRLQQGQTHPPVLPTLLLDLANLDPANLCGARYMGATAGLQIDLIRAQPDADQSDLALPHGRHHRHCFHQTGVCQQIRIRNPGLIPTVLAPDSLGIPKAGDL